MMNTTATVVDFVRETRLDAVPTPVRAIAKEHILDGLGVALSGVDAEGTRILRRYVERATTSGAATAVGTRLRLQPEIAAWLNGTSGHALDYDDTQLSTTPTSVYGLLTHPTVPVLFGALGIAEERGASGPDLLLAYVLGIEVACRLADAISPRHYQEGFHSTATMGGFGSAAAVGKLLGLDADTLARAFGLAGSLAGGLRENFGTMTKPFHSGRAAYNGVLACLLAGDGMTSASTILEAKRGFFAAAGGGYDADKIVGKLGAPYFLLEPGVSIKPYPSGSLSHPAQDVILDLVKSHDLAPEDVARVRVGTNSNVPNALIYPRPTTELEAKFSLQFCMAVAVVRRRAGLREFTNETVADPEIQAMEERVLVEVDPELEALGFEHVRAKVTVELTDGRTLFGEADVAIGHPLKPMSQSQLEDKFRECADGVLSTAQSQQVIDSVWELEEARSLDRLVAALRP
ncbi:MAG TPA: MmgE/PrpD family protein [Chloroflexota bacterium]|nr:MmgE/PrpD family protein [Chloroflexota bacterium]